MVIKIFSPNILVNSPHIYAYLPKITHLNENLFVEFYLYTENRLFLKSCLKMKLRNKDHGIGSFLN